MVRPAVTVESDPVVRFHNRKATLPGWGGTPVPPPQQGGTAVTRHRPRPARPSSSPPPAPRSRRPAANPPAADPTTHRARTETTRHPPAPPAAPAPAATPPSTDHAASDAPQR